ncbi:MAG TPA: lytic murein transglycosylase [Methylotenera sp.]|nr:lytic murein transglycosylase [Methylotenera sp.]HPH06502.1 lytic murein transglycosylase [Methylotenera sp.]HPN01263.1 lytic murein transglycosylase [Methylotenera sp.]
MQFEIIKNKLKQSVVLILAFFSLPTLADEVDPFAAWLQALKEEAIATGVSSQTIQKTFKQAQYLPRIIALDRAQPEFITPFLSYLEKRVDADKISQGRQMLLTHEDMLAKIETQYGVPKETLIAFWGMETNYGSNKGNFGLPSSLMTLAYDGRRSTFFREQLINTMRIVDAGHNNVAGMRGSWAGAMGHMQFMPSTLLKYGVDADADGRINIWSSLNDAFASAANYLAQVGWRKDEATAMEVKLPANFDYQLAQLNSRKTSQEWQSLGVTAIDNTPLPAHENAAILLPQGYRGPAMMVFSNFDAVMDWNKSVNYALSVSYLAQQLREDKPIIGGAEAEKSALTYNQILALQKNLNALGFDCGESDGFPGLKTQAAIRQYQATQQLPQDGYASPSLYQLLLVNKP